MEHIFTGYDHLAVPLRPLLVAAARGLSRGARYTLGIVTAFTVAHSVTLIAAGLGIVRLPRSIVEPAIALSIAYVAVENLVVRRAAPALALDVRLRPHPRLRLRLGAAEIGLPPSGVVPSLVSFNVGVELGQLCVVAAVAPLLLWLVPRYGQAARVRIVGSGSCCCSRPSGFSSGCSEEAGSADGSAESVAGLELRLEQLHVVALVLLASRAWRGFVVSFSAVLVSSLLVRLRRRRVE